MTRRGSFGVNIIALESLTEQTFAYKENNIVSRSKILFAQTHIQLSVHINHVFDIVQKTFIIFAFNFGDCNIIY